METPEPDIVSYACYPYGVQTVIVVGGNSLMGLIDDDTVLKYPQQPPEKPSHLNDKQARFYERSRQYEVAGIDVEEQIFGVLGDHQRIVGFKGRHQDGLLPEHMPNGSVADYVHNCSTPIPHWEK